MQETFDRNWEQFMKEQENLSKIQEKVREKFGVSISREQAFIIWSEYSDSMAAGWLVINDETIAHALITWIGD